MIHSIGKISTLQDMRKDTHTHKFAYIQTPSIRLQTPQSAFTHEKALSPLLLWCHENRLLSAPPGSSWLNLTFNQSASDNPQSLCVVNCSEDCLFAYEYFTRPLNSQERQIWKRMVTAHLIFNFYCTFSLFVQQTSDSINTFVNFTAKYYKLGSHFRTSERG